VGVEPRSINPPANLDLPVSYLRALVCVVSGAVPKKTRRSHRPPRAGGGLLTTGGGGRRSLRAFLGTLYYNLPTERVVGKKNERGNYNSRIQQINK